MPSRIYLPVAFAIVLVIGIFVGQVIPSAKPKFTPDSKLRSVLAFIENNYVDTVKQDQLIEKAIESMLEQLDPHSSYIPPQIAERMNESMKGNFQGVGIEFKIFEDTLRITGVVERGPSELAGIISGDRIISVDGENITGKNLQQEKVFTMLRGEGGTRVNVSIIRPGERTPLSMNIIRGTIPIASIDAAFMIDRHTGYIKLLRFSETSAEEFEKVLHNLIKQGMTSLIFDLRDNGGGVLSSAVSIADHFLKKGEMIVYTLGTNYPKSEEKATSKGLFEDGKIAVLINEESASASEIIAGAIQDTDRGIIIGRRSFGKGLVQQQRDFSDGSALRLTVARYYTPSGRSIQKPYEEGSEKYYEEISQREKQTDTVASEAKQSYRTRKGKVVYGGGGISPDIIVKTDSLEESEVFKKMIVSEALFKFAYRKIDSERKQWKNKGEDYFFREFKVSEAELNSILRKAGFSHDAVSDPLRQKIRMWTSAYAARNIFGDNLFYRYVIQADVDVNQAMIELRK